MEKTGDPVKDFFGVILRSQTYLNLLYLALAFPLGLLYFILLVTGFALGFGLAFLLVGLLILALMFVVWWLLIAFERQLAIGLLRVPIGPMEKGFPAKAGFWEQTRTFISNPVVWKGLVFLLAKFPLGIISFVALVTAAAVTAGLVAAPVIYPIASIDLGFMRVDTLGEAFVAMAIGVLIGFASLHVLNGLAYGSGAFARVMLGTTPEAKPAVPEAVATAPAASSAPVDVPEAAPEAPTLEVEKGVNLDE